MEYEEFVRRFNERAKKRAEELQKATAKAHAEVDRIVSEAKKQERNGAMDSRSDHRQLPDQETAPNKQENPARRHRRVQGILKQM